MSIPSLFEALAALDVNTVHGERNEFQPAGTTSALPVDSNTLADMLKATKPKLLVWVQTHLDVQHVQELANVLRQAQALPCHVLVATHGGSNFWTAPDTLPEGISVTFWPADQGALALFEQLQRHDVRVDAMLPDALLPAAVFSEWCTAARKAASERFWMLGIHAWNTGCIAMLEAAASMHGLNLAFSANAWIATTGGWALPTLAAPIAGGIEPVRYASVSAVTDEIGDRAAFLACLRAGVSSYRRHGSSTEFSNPLPANIASQSPEQQAHFCRLHFPPYKLQESSAPHLLVTLRDVRVAGVRGYMYARGNDLLEESMGIGETGVQAIKTILPSYEPILQEAVASNERFQWRALAAVFPPSIRLKGPYVVAMWPDTYIYHHWLMGCLPRFWYLDEYPELAGLPIVMNPFMRRYQSEYMHMLGLDSSRIVFAHESVSLHLSHAIYPTHFGNAPHSPQSIQWLRDKFLRHAAPVPAGFERGLYYISRRDGRAREISNEAQILEFLKPYGFEVVEWSAFTVSEQIGMAHHAKVIIGAHGSNMSNTIYINPRCKVLDIRNNRNSGDDLTLSAATMRISGHLYVTPSRRVNPLGDVVDNNVPDMSHDNYLVDFDDFRAVFAEMMDA